MLPLIDAIPLDKLGSKFKDISEKVIATDVRALSRKKPTQITELSMFIWDEMVHRGLVEDPSQVADLIEPGGNKLFRFVEGKLGLPAVTDLYATTFFCKSEPRYSFIDLSVAQCFPDDLHIIDVEFADINRPVAKTTKQKGHRSFHGLRIFGEFIERLEAVAVSRGVGRLSAVAISREVQEVFSREGFRVSETPAAKMAQFVGVGIPMIREVSAR